LAGYRCANILWRVHANEKITHGLLMIQAPKAQLFNTEMLSSFGSCFRLQV